MVDLMLAQESAQVLASQTVALGSMLNASIPSARRGIAGKLMANVRLLGAGLDGDKNAPYVEMEKAARLDLSDGLYEAMQEAGAFTEFEKANLPTNTDE